MCLVLKREGIVCLESNCMKSQALLIHLNTEVLHANELMIIRAIQGLSIKKKRKEKK